MKSFTDFLNERTDPHLEANAESGDQSTYKHFLQREITDDQKKSGDYAKGHIVFNAGGSAFNITIENPRNSIRVGFNREWMCRQSGHYGFIENTVGADGDELDVLIGPEHDSKYVLIINQVEWDRSKPLTDITSTQFDEHKIMLGYNTRAEAIKAYFDCYEPDWNQPAFAAVDADVDDLRDWVDNRDTTAPYTELREESK